MMQRRVRHVIATQLDDASHLCPGGCSRADRAPTGRFRRRQLISSGSAARPESGKTCGCAQRRPLTMKPLAAITGARTEAERQVGKTTSRTPEVRPARIDDIPAMARVHVRSWQQTYRGLMSDEILDDPGFVSRRERLWTAALSDERYANHRVAVAEHCGKVVGIAMAGPPTADDSSLALHLYVLYLLDAHHGSGAGSELLEAVLGPTESASLWVADPNPRAQAFYSKHGFRPDGTYRVEDGVREIRMSRSCTDSEVAIRARS
jgi:GNAT superfamily N-acetyltransferase